MDKNSEMWPLVTKEHLEKVKNYVDIGVKDLVKVVCGAPNAKEGLLTIYAPPGAIIPKNQMKLEVSKIRGVTSYGMLCSEFELNLSEESEGIVELSNTKYNTKIMNKNAENIWIILVFSFVLAFSTNSNGTKKILN